MQLLKSPKLILFPLFLFLVFLFFDIFPQPINSFCLKIKKSVLVLSLLSLCSLFLSQSTSPSHFFLFLCFPLTLQTTIIIILFTWYQRNWAHFLYGISVFNIVGYSLVKLLLGSMIPHFFSIPNTPSLPHTPVWQAPLNIQTQKMTTLGIKFS